MESAVTSSALGLATAVGLLLVVIVLLRFATARRRRIERPLRESFEVLLAEHLSGDEALPSLPSRRGERRVFRAVALNALSELRGRERERLTHLLEEGGLVDEAAQRLRSRRRLTRRRAADELAQIRSARAVDSLVGGLRDRDRTVAIACARGLAELGDEQHIPLLLPIAEGAAEAVPGAAAELLLALGARSPQTLATLYEATVSKPMRRLVAAVAGELRLAELAPLLRGAVAEDDDELAARAVRGLGLIGDVDALDLLLDVLAGTTRPAYVQAVAAQAIGQIGDPRALEALRHALGSSSWLLGEKAAAALSLLGQAGRDVLTAAAVSSQPSLAAHARAALAR